jgi:hypothetical protein
MQTVEHGLHLRDSRSNTSLGISQIGAQGGKVCLKAEARAAEVNSVSHSALPP